MVTIESLAKSQWAGQAKIAAKRIYNIVVVEEEILSPKYLEDLAEANARAEAETVLRNAISMREAINGSIPAGELDPATASFLAKRLKSSLSSYLNANDTHKETLRVLNDYIRALETDD